MACGAPSDSGYNTSSAIYELYSETLCLTLLRNALQTKAFQLGLGTLPCRDLIWYGSRPTLLSGYFSMLGSTHLIVDSSEMYVI